MHYYIRSRPKDKLSTRYTSIVNGFPKKNPYNSYSYNFIWIADINIKSSEIVDPTPFDTRQLVNHRISLNSKITSYFLSEDRSKFIIYIKPEINKWEF